MKVREFEGKGIPDSQWFFQSFVSSCINKILMSTKVTCAFLLQEKYWNYQNLTLLNIEKRHFSRTTDQITVSKLPLWIGKRFICIVCLYDNSSLESPTIFLSFEWDHNFKKLKWRKLKKLVLFFCLAYWPADKHI